MIAVWGSSRDHAALAVFNAVRALTADAVFLDEEDLRSTDSAGVIVAGRRIELEQITALYARPGDAAPTALWDLANDGEITVINRPRNGQSNASKPLQSMLLTAAGFDVPDTLLTTTPDSARAFIAEHPAGVVYKSISSSRSIVTRWSEADDQRIDTIASCPTMLQEWIAGPDVRVHVVAGQIFGCLVTSDADDYRYADRFGAGVQLKPTAIPPDIAQRAVEMARSLELVIAGLDFRLRPDGTWCCFEVNPSPAFAFYAPTSDAVAAAIARELLAPRDSDGA